MKFKKSVVYVKGASKVYPRLNIPRQIAKGREWAIIEELPDGRIIVEFVDKETAEKVETYD